MGPIGSPKTSVSNHLTPRNNPEERRIQFNCGESLRSSQYLILNLYRGMNIDIYIFGIVHGVRGEFPDDVSGPTAAGPETSSENSRRTLCKIP